MTDADPAALSKLVDRCRELLANELCDLIDEMGPALVQDVQAMAASSRDEAKRTACLHLRIDLQADWRKVAPQLRDALARRVAAGKAGERAGYESHGAADLKILSDEDLTLQLAVRGMVDRVSHTCSEETQALERRIAHLVMRNALPRGESPFRVDVVCASVDAALVAVFPEVSRRIVLLQMVSGHLAEELPQLYRAVNENLIEGDVLPHLKRSYQAPASASSGAANAEAAKITGTLERLAKARAPAGSTPAAANAAPSPAFMNSLNALPKVEPAATPGSYTNVVSMARDSEAARNVRPLEAVTLDIVAALFDLIFGDEHVAEGIKALVSRLQMPVLKVAMLNQQFFADRTHPARRFLDSISAIAIRWGKAVDVNDPFYRKLSELVERVQHTYDGDNAVFEAAIAELGEFTAERDVIEAEANRALAEAVRAREEEIRIQREGQARAQQTANQALATVLQQDLPTTIDAFLRSYWRDVVQGRIFSSGTDSASFREALQCALELAWSVAPKREADERRKQVALLPALLKRLNAGLDELGVTADERRSFMDTLVELQLAALRAEVRTEPKTAKRPEATPEAKSANATLQVTHATKSGVQVQDISLPGGADPGGENTPDRTNLRRVRQLVRGDWVDFISIGQTRRERLTWINPSRSLFLFSNHAAECAISITPEALALRLRNRTAMLVKRDTPMFERALNGAVQSLDATTRQ